MTIKELKDKLSQFDDSETVIIGSGYVDDIGKLQKEHIVSFFGKDYDAIVLYRGNQLGKIDF